MRAEAGARKLLGPSPGPSCPEAPANLPGNLGRQETLNGNLGPHPNPPQVRRQLASRFVPVSPPEPWGTVPCFKEAAEKRPLRCETDHWILESQATKISPLYPLSPNVVRREIEARALTRAPHRPHFTTFLQGLGRCQGACGSRVKVGWLITITPPLEALGRVFAASPALPPRPGEGAFRRKLAFSRRF